MMKTLIKYEFLKVLRKKSTLIAIAVSLLITAVSSPCRSHSFKFIIKMASSGGWKVLHTKKNSMRTFLFP